MNQIWLRPWEPDSSFHVKTHRVLSFLEFFFLILVLLVGSHMGENLETSFQSDFHSKWEQLILNVLVENWTENQSENRITQWEPPQHWFLHQVKLLVEGITKIGPALNYYCIVRFSFGNALDLGLHHTLKWCLPKAQSLKLGVIFVQNLRGVLHHCWPVIKNGNRYNQGFLGQFLKGI
jgi:hypothetical protein